MHFAGKPPAEGRQLGVLARKALDHVAAGRSILRCRQRKCARLDGNDEGFKVCNSPTQSAPAGHTPTVPGRA